MVHLNIDSWGRRIKKEIPKKRGSAGLCILTHRSSKTLRVTHFSQKKKEKRAQLEKNGEEQKRKKIIEGETNDSVPLSL